MRSYEEKTKIVHVLSKFFFVIFIILLLSSCKSENSINLTSQDILVKKYLGLDQNSYRSLTGDGVTVAILDSGISNHIDIPQGKVIYFKDFVNRREHSYDDNGHGTFVAGIIGADGLYQGLAPSTKFVILKVTNKNGESNYETLHSAVTWLMDNKDKYHIDVVNISLGLKNYVPDDTDEIAHKIKKMNNSGVIFLASAGNEGPDDNSILFPGNLPEVITVGYINNKRTISRTNNKVAENSSRGSSTSGQKKPDLVTVGVDIKSLTMKDTYDIESGSSFATAIVTGVICLLLEKHNGIPSESIQELYSNLTLLNNEPANSQGNGEVTFKIN